jgi:phenylacetate-CoA ligase
VIEAGEIVHGSPFLFSVSTDPAALVQWFPAGTPLAALVAALNDAQPTQINCYGSVMEELGAEALSGRLKISPHRVTTNSEPLCRRHAMLSEKFGAWRSTICGAV